MEQATRASDAELVDASLRGERAAFGELVERCAGMVTAVSYAATRDHVLSEDLTQDTFVAAWRDLARLRDPRAVRPWLCRIARNLAHKARRRRREVATADLDDHAAAQTPFDRVARDQAERVVRRALDGIPAQYREALVLFYCEGRSSRDVAIALGVSEDVVHQRLSRGRRHLAAGVEQLVAHALDRPRSRRELAACVLAALPIALVARTSRAATKGSHMWKSGTLGLAGALVIAATVAAWSSPVEPGDPPGRLPAATTVVPAGSRAASPVLPPAAPASTAAPSCALVARHLLDLLQEPTTPTIVERLEDQCRADGWSPRELACMLAADDASSADACKAPRPWAPPDLAPAGTELGCAAVADHMLAVSPPPAHDDRPEAQYASLHAELETSCTRDAWSELRRRCTIVAESGRMMARCLALDAVPPELAPGGDTSCTAVGRHVADVIAAEDDAPPDPTDLPAHLAAVCLEEQWPASHRRCLVATTRFAEIFTCRATSP